MEAHSWEKNLYLVVAILVTGIIRSGTTWLGKILNTAEHTIYLHEPFNPRSYWNACIPMPIEHYYLNDENGRIYLKLFRQMLELDPIVKGNWKNQAEEEIQRLISEACGEKCNKSELIPILKDPIAILSVEWLVKYFKVKPVILLRHPLGIVSSLMRLGWAKTFNLNVFKNQPLIADHLLHNSQELEDLYSIRFKGLEAIDRACLFVRFLYLVIVEYTKSHPNWIFVKYEDLVSYNSQISNLFETLELSPSAATHNIIQSVTQDSYEPSLAHQRTLNPMPHKSKEFLRPMEHIPEPGKLIEAYFKDILASISKFVKWQDIDN